MAFLLAFLHFLDKGELIGRDEVAAQLGGIFYSIILFFNHFGYNRFSRLKAQRWLPSRLGRLSLWSAAARERIGNFL